jgi:hypothetical protein
MSLAPYDDEDVDHVASIAGVGSHMFSSFPFSLLYTHHTVNLSLGDEQTLNIVSTISYCRVDGSA